MTALSKPDYKTGFLLLQKEFLAKHKECLAMQQERDGYKEMCEKLNETLEKCVSYPSDFRTQIAREQALKDYEDFKKDK